jgi:hypothetical protein
MLDYWDVALIAANLIAVACITLFYLSNCTVIEISPGERMSKLR